MKIRINNSKVIFGIKAYSSGVITPPLAIIDNAHYSVAGNWFKTWYFKNESNSIQTYRIYDCIANIYTDSIIACIEDAIPVAGNIGHDIKYVTKKSNVDLSIEVPEGKILVIMQYGLAYSTKDTPKVSLDGVDIPLPI